MQCLPNFVTFSFEIFSDGSSLSKSKLLRKTLCSGLGWAKEKMWELLDVGEEGVINNSFLHFLGGVGLHPIASSSKACVLKSIDSLKKLSSSKTSLVLRFTEKTKTKKTKI